jgi:hypothetical protein
MNRNCVSEAAANRDAISCLAFQLWENAGCPEGQDLEFWLKAETHFLAPQRPEAIKVETVAAKPSFGKRARKSPFQQRTTTGAA